MKRRVLSLAVALVLVVVALAACSGKAAETAAPAEAPATEAAAEVAKEVTDAVEEAAEEVAAVKEDKDITIGVSIQGNQSGFLQYVVTGMLNYVKANNPDVTVNLVYADDDAAKQLTQVETFVNQGVDAIVLNPVDKVQSATAVDLAHDAGIPVVTVNTISDSPNVSAHVGSDDVQSGEIQMQRIIDVCGEDCKVAYIDAVLGHSAQVGRSQGYENILKNYPNVQYTHDCGNWSGDESMKLVEDWLQKGEDFDAILCMADCQLIGVVTAVENAGKTGEIVLTGMDCDPAIMPLIESGVVDSSVWQDGVGQGENSIRLAIEAAKGKEISDYIIPYELCTKDTYDDFQARAEERIEAAGEYF